MNSFGLSIWDDEGSKCTFYTVIKEDQEVYETDKFFLKFDDPANGLIEESQELMQLIIESIGNTYGAIDAFFNRHERKALALPPKRERYPGKYIQEVVDIGVHFPLRLYCIRITKNIVVLFNGGIKIEGLSHQDCPDLSPKFIDAQIFASKIQAALNDGMIVVSENGRKLVDFNGEEEIIIY